MSIVANLADAVPFTDLPLGPSLGGTGVDNGVNTLTLTGNTAFLPLTTGSYTFTGNLLGDTAVTFPTSGTLATTAGVVTAVTASSPLASTGGTTPDISFTGVLAAANGGCNTVNSGYIAFNTQVTFNGLGMLYFTFSNSMTTNITLPTSGTLFSTTSLIPGTNGGTGVNNGVKTITLGGNLTTSGAFASTFTMTGTTNVTFPTSGTLATTAGVVTAVTASSPLASSGGTTPNISFTGVLDPSLGGTGINNGSNTITIAGNLATSGAFASTFTMTGSTNVTFPTSGTLATTATANVISVAGTANRITVSPTTGNCIVDISAAYVGQSSLTTLGTVTTGAWNATAIGPTFGGTGQTTYTLGDILYSSATNTLTQLSGNTTAVKQYLSQTGTGTISAAPSWATITGADITGSPLTAANDTNITLTLGGTPSTSLLRAASITAGWSGQLSLTRGGLNASLTASNGGIFYSTASAGAILSGTATAAQMLQSGASTAPTWSTTTWPTTSTVNQILYSTATSVIGGSANLTFNGTTLNLAGTTASTSNTTGVVTTAGGIGISNTTDASSSTNGGTFTTAGGAAIAKTLYAGSSIITGGNVTAASGSCIAINGIFSNVVYGNAIFPNNSGGIPGLIVSTTLSGFNTGFWTLNNGGLLVSWNNNGAGETDFLCNGGGNTAGFYFYYTNTSHTSPTLILEITPSVMAFTGQVINYVSAMGALGYASGGAGTDLIYFVNPANSLVIGKITNVSNTSVTYNTTSDYRLKTNIMDIPDTLEMLPKLKPCNFEFKEALGSVHQGFIAHELQEHMPMIVTGEKDAVGKEGDPKEYSIIPQMIDYGKLTPFLVKVCQELYAKILALESREITHGAN